MLSRIDKNKEQITKINREEHKNKVIKTSKFILKIFILLFVIISLMYVSIRYIGNMGLVVKEYSISYDNLPDSFYGLKIIQISDIDFDNDVVSLRKIKNLVKKINSIEPDIIIFTGDLIYGEIDSNTKSEFESILAELEATVGKYAVFGEQDDDTSKIIIKNAGFSDISNSYDLIYKDGYDPILIVGLDSSNANIDEAFAYQQENSDIFTIMISHKTDIIDDVLETYKVDLAMAGHSLNGLIKIPGLGGIFTSDGCRKYFDSYYRINDTDLYISGGIGTRSYKYRLFNNPSINFYRLK